MSSDMLKRVTAVDNKSGDHVVREGQRFNTVAAMVTSNGRVSVAMNNVVLKNPDSKNVRLAVQNRKATKTGPEVFNELRPVGFGMQERHNKPLKAVFKKYEGQLKAASGVKDLKFEAVQERSLKSRVSKAESNMDKAKVVRENHAEMQLVTRHQEMMADDSTWKGKKMPKILGLAASKVACARCHAELKARGIPHSGPPGKDFPNWVAPPSPSKAGGPSPRRASIREFRPQDAAPPIGPTSPKNQPKPAKARHLNNKKNKKNYRRPKNNKGNKAS